MKKVSVAVLLLALTGLALAQDVQVVEKQYQGYKGLRIKTVSGDVEIQKGKANQIKVKVSYQVEPEDAFEPRFIEGGAMLRLEEDWAGNSYRSEVRWTLTVPENMDIRFSTASGDLLAEGLSLELDASTASGDIELNDVKGKFDLSTASGEITLDDAEGRFDMSTASGDIELDGVKGEVECSTASGDIDLDDCQGEIECSTASGDVEGRGLSLDEMASFSTASGDVALRLSAPLKADLELSAASGSVTLDHAGQAIRGTFILEARKNRGRISAPFSFDSEETFERHGQTYLRKTAKVKGDTPQIEMSTASGRVVVKS